MIATHEVTNQAAPFVDVNLFHANRPLRRILGRVGITRQLRPESFNHSVHECVEAFQGTNRTDR